MSADEPAAGYRHLIARYGGDIEKMARAGFAAEGRGVVVMDLRSEPPVGTYMQAERYVRAIEIAVGVVQEVEIVRTYDAECEAIVCIMTPEDRYGGAFRYRFP